MSLTDRKLKYFKKDEKMAKKEYAEAAEKADNTAMKLRFREMSHDEGTHENFLKEMLEERIEEKQKEKMFRKRKRKYR